MFNKIKKLFQRKRNKLTPSTVSVNQSSNDPISLLDLNYVIVLEYTGGDESFKARCCKIIERTDNYFTVQHSDFDRRQIIWNNLNNNYYFLDQKEILSTLVEYPTTRRFFAKLCELEKDPHNTP